MPRQCGIATFSFDLAGSLSDVCPALVVDSIALSDHDGYDYPDRVRFEVADGDLDSYRTAASFLNSSRYDVLSIQHEYGIFGGDSGDYLLELVRAVKMPIVTTLHTVLREPSESQRRVLDELLQLSERVVVMSQKAVEFLQEVHGLQPDKIDLIPHGIPDIPAGAGDDIRSQLGISGPMILTFGLLSPDKGIQHVIEAMPAIVHHHPDAIYFVVGATHPHVRADSGELYRESLGRLATDLGVSDHVRFVDRFVSAQELVAYLSAMDIYVTPYLNPKQITSGTLAYSVGAGKPVISTPYWYAEELLADGRGILVPFRDSEAIAKAVLFSQLDASAREAMGRAAAEYGRHMLWPEVGKRYLATFDQAKRDSGERLRVIIQGPRASFGASVVLPILNLRHLADISDDTGILQHATFNIANRSEGYCVDDNARALLLLAYLEDEAPLNAHLDLLQSRYLGFVINAYNQANGRFRNFMSYDRQWLEEAGSNDSQARSLWALGAVVGRCRNPGRRAAADVLFLRAAPGVLATDSLRAWAYGILAAQEYVGGLPHQSAVQSLMERMSSRLLRQFEANRSPDWPWPEGRLTYANARLPQALVAAGLATKHPGMLEVGLSSLAWLMEVQTGPEGVFAPIGTNGFFPRGGHRSTFDQQPLEAWASVSACLAAERATGDRRWLTEAHRAFAWFMGRNMLGQPLVDPITGGCQDGLHEGRVNRNQGAESTLAYLCALTELRQATSDAPVPLGVAGIEVE